MVLFKFWIASNGVFSLFCVNGSGSLAVLLFLLGSSETHYHADVRDMLRGRPLKLNLNCTNTFMASSKKPAPSLPSRTIASGPQTTGTVIYLMTHEAVFTLNQCVCVLGVFWLLSLSIEFFPKNPILFILFIPDAMHLIFHSKYSKDLRSNSIPVTLRPPNMKHLHQCM